MQFAALANFALDQESIISEFNEIPTITARADEVPPGCESKNRYSNVIPLPETRVMLKQISGDESSEYINANYVRVSYKKFYRVPADSVYFIITKKVCYFTSRSQICVTFVMALNESTLISKTFASEF